MKSAIKTIFSVFVFASVLSVSVFAGTAKTVSVNESVSESLRFDFDKDGNVNFEYDKTGSSVAAADNVKIEVSTDKNFKKSNTQAFYYAKPSGKKTYGTGVINVKSKAGAIAKFTDYSALSSKNKKGYEVSLNLPKCSSYRSMKMTMKYLDKKSTGTLKVKFTLKNSKKFRNRKVLYIRVRTVINGKMGKGYIVRTKTSVKSTALADALKALLNGKN